MPRTRALIAAAVTTAVAAATVVTPQAATAAPTTPPSVVGAQTSGDSLFPKQGNGGYDVTHYDIDLAWATGNTITATTTVTATTTQAPLSQFSLDLEGLTVSAVTVDNVAATYSRIATGGAFKLVVTPATPVTGQFVTKVTYSGTPTSHTDPDGSSEGWVSTGTGPTSGAVALNEPVGAMTWFPNNNTPKDKATFTTRITVPYSATSLMNRVAASNGVLTSTTTGTSTRTFVWDQTKQQATYLALVGIGPYTASTSNVALTVGTTPEWSYTDPLAAGATQFNTSRNKLSAILKGLEKYYGTYPGSSTGLVLDVSSLGYALETQDRPYFENSIAEPTLIHELAHQWFGNAVSPADWSDIWLNEGPATFMETQIGADLNGSTSTQDTYYANWNSSNAAFWSTPAAGFTDPTDLFGAQTYDRGAIALEALRSALGDAVFIKGMLTWQQTYGGGSATTAQFIDVMEAVSGYDLTAFFDTWIYGTTKPAAWPAAFELSLASTPATGATVQPGATVSYTVTAQNSGKVSTGSSVVAIDATQLVAQGTLGALPANVTRDGNTLLWAVPATAVGATATTTVTAVLDRPSGTPVAVTTRGRTLGADCGTCLSTLTLKGAAIASSVPTISGTVRVGETVTAVTGTWSDGVTFAYQWLRNGTPIAGATSSSYAVTPGDEGAALTVAVTGSKTGATSVTRTSEPVTVAPGVIAPAPTPTISGTPRVDTAVTGVVGAWDAGATLAYQWLVDGSPVAGATTTTFTARPADAGKALTFAVTGTRAGYTTTTRNSAAATVLEGALSPTPTPTISGTAQVDKTVTAVAGTWDSGATLVYQWLVDGVAVAGATTTSFTPRPGDAGRPLTVAVTGTRAGYANVTRTSEQVTVLAGVLDPTPTPTISGEPRVGSTLTAVPGTWDAGATLAYQWLLDDAPIAGATSSTYSPVASQVDHDLRVAVTGTRPGYTTVTRTSSKVTVTASDAPVSPTPTVTGLPRVGETLTVVPGEWSDGAVLSYQWFVGGLPVTGATDTTYVPVADDLGKAVTVTVTGTRTSGVTVRTSEPVTVEAGVLSPTPVPTLSGDARVGSTVTAVPGTWDARATLTYQWYVDDVAVAGATGSSYSPVAGDVDHALSVAVTGSRAGYTTVTQRSAAVTVLAGVLSPTPMPTISGRALTDRTVTAVPGAWDPAATLTYQWSLDGTPVPGATTRTYRARPADVRKFLTVTVTGSRDGYPSVSRTSAPTTVGIATQTRRPRPTVKGLAVVGRTLRAVAGAHDPGTRVRYAWFVAGKGIPGATRATYQVRPRDLGKRIKVLTGTAKPGYYTVIRASTLTKKVTKRG